MSGFRLLLNGATPTLADLQALAMQCYGNYTSFIVQEGAVRGWSLHQRRLRKDAATLLGTQLDGPELRRQLRAALVEAHGPQSVRISVHPRQLQLSRLDLSMPADLLIRSSDWQAHDAAPMRLRSSVGLREAAQHKHLGLSGALLARRRAQLAGADDALLLDGEGQIAEGPTWNLGMYDGYAVHWPNAPALAGVTQALLSEALAAAGVRSVHGALRGADLLQARTVFACNARQPCIPIIDLDQHPLRRDAVFEALLKRVWQDVPLEPV